MNDQANLPAAAFYSLFYERVPPADLAGRDQQTLADASSSIWQFAQQRAHGTPNLRLLPAGADGHAVVEIVNDDMPFLVDSVTATLATLGLSVQLVIHPVISVRRDADGVLLDLTPQGTPESLMRIEVTGLLTEARGQAVLRRLREVLDHVRVVVGDWAAMRAKVLEMAADLGGPTSPSPYRAEAAAFLDWIADDNFVFLGTREYAFAQGLQLQGGSGRGLLRDDAFMVFDNLRDLSARSPEVQKVLRTPQPMMLSKSMRRSPVHRLLPMDTIGVKMFDNEGRVTGMRLVIGLFTRASYFRPPNSIPMLRQKRQRCLTRAGFAPDSHDGRALSRILDAFPRDELLQIDEAQLYDTAIGLLHLEQRPRVALFVLRDPFERFVTCLVYLTAERYNSEVRSRMGAILARAFEGSVIADSTRFDESPLARIHFVIATTPGRLVHPDLAEVERALVEAGRVWSDRLADALMRMREAPTAEAALRRFGEAFPPPYAQRFTASEAVADIALIELVAAGAPLAARLDGIAEGTLRLKTCQAETPTVLSDMLPVLENLGVRVRNENPFEIAPREGGRFWLQEFTLQPRDGTPAPDAAALFEAALREVWSGGVENDGFNRLVLSAGLDVQLVVVLRAYCKILRQVGSSFSQAYMEDTLAAHPALARDLIALFEAQFDPVQASEARARDIAASIEAALDDVANLDEDRILRSFLKLIRHSLRTNRYRRDRQYLSIKLASQEIDLLPRPRPLVEIHVYSPWMEGCHLRGGRVARGGIRWSDRREDFRTEILGLMKAQMVKNAVIVPVGSKGGFVVKRPPAERAALMTEVVRCYQTLIRGLLDITDNYAGTTIVPPEDVVRRDGDDPYLVVAADKGTATFSDIANALAIEYGFWLGDAFASGGSIGYDHKAMGITAKGAWEAVKRHFRELGTDIQTTPFTCIGVGDMSGDVFGNGMLLSRQTRLLAAFNHLHIFIDPDPDPAASWAERRRLFALPASTWADYAPAALSKGGAVFARNAKTVTLSPEAQAVFGPAGPVLSPAELISVLLRHPADLLWFGGIGTYVKATGESHADAGDRVNDSLRVDAASLRARVIGEGANLAMTQRARIEYALAGGRLNTDAIDNSAGVDTSDHEVNIKIGVGAMIEAGVVPAGERKRFLGSLIDEVEQLVLVDNILQTQALSLAVQEGGEALERHARLMRALERERRLDRMVEFLPDEKALAVRAAAKLGLTRPELAVLMAYAKNTLYDALLAGTVPDDADLGTELLAYFPHQMRVPAIAEHRLKREIIATKLANELINRMGISFVAELMEATGADVATITRSFLIVREVFALPALWAEIEALDNLVPAATQLALLREVAQAAEQAISWFATSGIALEIAARRREFGAGFATLSTSLPPPPSAWDGVPAALAARVASLSSLVTSMDVVQLAQASGIGVVNAGAAYFGVGDALGLARLRLQARHLPGDTSWARIARDALIQDSYGLQRRLAHSVLTGGGNVSRWLEAQGASMAGIEAGLMEMARTDRPDLALLGVVIRRIWALG